MIVQFFLNLWIDYFCWVYWTPNLFIAMVVFHFFIFIDNSLKDSNEKGRFPWTIATYMKGFFCLFVFLSTN